MIVTIYLGNLSHQVSKANLEEVFADYGAVKKVALPVDRETGKLRGFGFVDLETNEQEDQAIQELDDAEWMGRQLRVNRARPRQNKRSGMGDRSSYQSGF